MKRGDPQRVFNISLFLLIPFLLHFFVFRITPDLSPRQTFLYESPNRSEKLILISPPFQFHLSTSSVFFFSPLSGIRIDSFFLPKFFPSLIALLIPSSSPPAISGCSAEAVRAVPWIILTQNSSTRLSPVSHTPKSIKTSGKVFPAARTLYELSNSYQPQRDTLGREGQTVI